MLYAAAGLMAGLFGAVRVVRDAHQLSDVVAGLAAGTLGLALVVVLSPPTELREP